MSSKAGEREREREREREKKKKRAIVTLGRICKRGCLCYRVLECIVSLF